jgi:hypothetical protein
MTMLRRLINWLWPPDPRPALLDEIGRLQDELHALKMERIKLFGQAIDARRPAGVSVRWDETEKGYRTDDGIVFKAYDR